MRYLLLFLICTACSLSKKDCETTDWYDRGLRDGRVGEFTSALTKYKEQCSAHNITVDAHFYKMGYNDGLKQFCTFDNGHKEGLAGRVDLNVCPESSRGEYYRGYWAGKNRNHNYEAQKNMEASARLEADRARLRALSECVTSTDCPRKDVCTNHSCSLSGVACKTDKECMIQPTCVPQQRIMGVASEFINVCQ
jgi:hypothetical protein